MATNVTYFEVKEIQDLHVPLGALHNLDWTVDLKRGNEIQAEGLCEMFWLKGVLLPGDVVAIDSLDFGGEGSGHTYTQFKELLRQTKGHLQVRLVWEGGNGINDLTVDDGEIQIMSL